MATLRNFQIRGSQCFPLLVAMVSFATFYCVTQPKTDANSSLSVQLSQLKTSQWRLIIASEEPQVLTYRIVRAHPGKRTF